MKPIILFVGDVTSGVAKRLKKLSEEDFSDYDFFILSDSNLKHKAEPVPHLKMRIEADFTSEESLLGALSEYRESIKAINCVSERSLPAYATIIQNYEHLNVPTSTSITQIIDKITQKKILRSKEPSIVAKNYYFESIESVDQKIIEKEIGFPCLIKPTGLASSTFVTLVFSPTDLMEKLSEIKKRVLEMNGTAKAAKSKPIKLYVEEFIQGEMYTMDGYVDNTGTLTACPLVRIITGFEAGYEDFFTHISITPTGQSDEDAIKAYLVAEKAVRAFKLKNTTVMFDLIKTKDEWKIIELGPRIGGKRVLEYGYVFGFDHQKNDILIRLGKKPENAAPPLGYSANVRLHAEKEGLISNISGIEEVRKLPSFRNKATNKNIGEQSLFARNGGSAPINVTLFNKSEDTLLEDIKAVKKLIKIEVV